MQHYLEINDELESKLQHERSSVLTTMSLSLI